MSDLHLGFIVDGNRRWAKERKLPPSSGHYHGYQKVEKTIDWLASHHIKYATFYLFSTENWGRAPKEVTYIMDLLNRKLDRLVKKLQRLDYKCVILGHPKPVDPALWQRLKKAEVATADGQSGTVSICFNYGGQQELADAATALISAGHTGEVTVADLNTHIYHPEIPPVDMIVRTSGEQRISGFMLWRAAYAEFLFLDKYFPEITEEDIDYILDKYHSRHRRYGK